MEINSKVIIENTKLNFKTNNTTTILDSGLNSNLNLPHRCKSGTCGSCRVNLVEGKIENTEGKIFSRKNFQNNKILLCQSFAKTKKVVIRYPIETLQKLDANYLQIGKIIPKDFYLEVTSNRQITPIVSELKVFVSPKLNFKFEAGMHVEILNKKRDLFRKYSICGAPDGFQKPKSQNLRFLIAKHNSHGMSTHLCNNTFPGDILHIKGPFNSFIFKYDYLKPILAIAGGTGIAPLLGILENFLRKDSNLSIMILLSVRNRKEILEMDNFFHLKQKYKNFYFKITLTRERTSTKNRFLFGRVENVLPTIFKDLSEHSIFICGSDGFVEHSVNSVLNLKAKNFNVFTEKFL